MDSSLERIALIPDLHCGDEDRRAIELACKTLEIVKPDRIIFLGDVLDFGWASQYPNDAGKSPGALKREVDAWTRALKNIKSACPEGTRIQVNQGNHEFRMMRGLIWQMPALRDWHGLSWGEILRCQEFDVEWVPESEIWLANRHFLVTHGKIVRKWSAYSAKAEFDDRGVSGASGHTHKMGQYYLTHTSTNEMYTWTECGHLSNNPPHYARPNEGRANWQHGFAVMAASGTEYRVPNLIPFWQKGRRYRARYADHEFEA